MKELKKCPFCGGEAEILNSDNMRNIEYVSNGNKYRIMCEICCCGTGVYFTPTLAIEAWNRRYKNEQD